MTFPENFIFPGFPNAVGTLAIGFLPVQHQAITYLPMLTYHQIDLYEQSPEQFMQFK